MHFWGIYSFQSDVPDNTILNANNPLTVQKYSDKRLLLEYSLSKSVSRKENESTFLFQIGDSESPDHDRLANSDPQSEVIRAEGHFIQMIYDKQSGNLKIFTDKFGGKRMYYHQNKKFLIFSSDALFIARYINADGLNPEALVETIDYRWLVGQNHLLSGVSILPSAHLLKVDKSGYFECSRYWRFVVFPKVKKKSIDESVKEIGNSLESHLARLSKKHAKCAVPLSGGIDSAILLAYALRHFDEVCAYTPYWETGENPELEMAKNFARHIGAEHRLVRVTDERIKADFYLLPKILQQISRHWSSIPLYELLQAIDEDTGVVLYGQGADTLFGTDFPIEFISTYKKLVLLQHIPVSMRRQLIGYIPGRFSKYDIIKKIRKLFTQELSDYNSKYYRVYYYTPSSEIYSNLKPSKCSFLPDADWSTEQFHKEIIRNSWETSGYDHLYHIEILKQSKPWTIAKPYITNEMRKIAEQLHHSSYKKNGWSKPILRKMASQFYPEEWIYRDKHGFSTPNTTWIKELFSDEIDRLSGHECGIIDHNKLKKLSAEKDYETIWTALSIEVYLREFTRSAGAKNHQ